MSCDRQKGKAREEVDEKDVGERLAIIGNMGASGKFQRERDLKNASANDGMEWNDEEFDIFDI